MLTIIWAVYGIMAVMPLFVGDVRFVMNIMIMCLIWAVVASCWDVIMGFAGIFSFGQVAFFVIGAYCSGILAIEHGVPPVLAIPLPACLPRPWVYWWACPALNWPGPMSPW
jgi:branched-chain amino acid transport system permease protein